MGDELKEKHGTEIVLDWYDGPLASIRRIDFADGEPLIEFSGLGLTEGTWPRTTLHVRFDRTTLEKMLDLLDGNAVVDWQGKEGL